MLPGRLRAYDSSLLGMPYDVHLLTCTIGLSQTEEEERIRKKG
jgi:hypothetical protein